MPRPHVPTVAARPAALLAAALIVGGCAGPPPGRDRAPEAGRRVDAAALADTDPRLCDPRPGRPVPGGQLTIALPDSIDPARAPEPANESERTVFRNFYETLVTIACNGEARPGLAESWNAADGGRRWTFALRAGACFWDGRPVTAQDVQDAWTATQRRAQAAGCLLPWAWLDVEAASVRALDARRLCILVPEPQADFPLLLAHPAYAVALPDPGRRWPLGTGPCRPLDGDGPLTCVPNPHHPEGHPAWERIVFAAPAAAWPAQGIDVALNADDAGVAGAEGGSLAPLPWNRIVLFLCPTGGAEAARWTADPRLGEALPDARPATALVFPGSWGATCPQLSGPAGGRGRRRGATARARRRPAICSIRGPIRSRGPWRAGWRPLAAGKRWGSTRRTGPSRCATAGPPVTCCRFRAASPRPACSWRRCWDRRRGSRTPPSRTAARRRRGRRSA